MRLLPRKFAEHLESLRVDTIQMSILEKIRGKSSEESLTLIRFYLTLKNGACTTSNLSDSLSHSLKHLTERTNSSENTNGQRHTKKLRRHTPPQLRITQLRALKERESHTLNPAPRLLARKRYRFEKFESWRRLHKWLFAQSRPNWASDPHFDAHPKILKCPTSPS